MKSVAENTNVGTSGGTLRRSFVFYPVVIQSCFFSLLELKSEVNFIGLFHHFNAQKREKYRQIKYLTLMEHFRSSPILYFHFTKL